MAQEAEEEAEPASEVEENAALSGRDPFEGEIVVTARRREEVLQEVPLAVSVVTGTTLEDVMATDISEIEKQVPNISDLPGPQPVDDVDRLHPRCWSGGPPLGR